jgi:radical SAM protein with 4Fe4S-binding SPASM domain
MRCLHCASDLDAERKKSEELSLQECLNLCEELYSLGCEEVTLSGGEALLSPKWEAIAQRVVSLDMRAAIISNGLVIDNTMANRIKDTGIYLVGLSFDGMEATHNYVRSNKESFQMVCKAIRELKSEDLEVCLISHINRLNLRELHAMEDFVASSSIDVWQLQLGASLGRLAKHRELLIQPKDLIDVADFIVAAKQRNRAVIAVGDSIGYYSVHEPELRRTYTRKKGFNFWCGCTAGCLNVGIEANGNVLGCLSLQSDRFVEGNLRSQSLMSIWTNKGGFSYTRDFKVQDLHGKCQDCEFGEICRGGCTAMAYGSSGSPHNNPYCLHGLQSNNLGLV